MVMALKSAAVPDGHPESSPAIHRRECIAKRAFLVAEGRPKDLSFGRPSATKN
jgi:hypothetical protein